MAKLRRLGKTDIEVTPIGLGCWQFSEGRGLIGGFWEALPTATVNEIVAATLRGGINWFDTAEIYGHGKSERALAAALKAAGKANGDALIATKWWPTLRTAKSIRQTIGERLECLGGFSIDLHQVHMPFGLSSVEAEMEVMAALVKARKIRSVGVSNFNAARMRRAHAELARLGLPLASNQVKYSLLDRSIESNGVMEAAQALGVTIMAYSPLEQGLLSGKFHDDPKLIKTRTGPRKWMPAFGASGLERSRPLIDELKKIATAHGVTASQVALAWLLQFHGDTVVAIPGASKVRHVEENLGANELQLTRPELDRIDELSREFK